MSNKRKIACSTKGKMKNDWLTIRDNGGMKTVESAQKKKKKKSNQKYSTKLTFKVKGEINIFSEKWEQ